MQRPKILEEAGFNIYVDTSKLKDLPLPTQQINIDDLVWCFDLPVWEKDGTDDWNLTPQEVIDNKEGTKEHRKQVEESDLKYPIVIIFNKGRWVVLDGIHRLVKAYLAGMKEIDVIVLTKESPYFQDASIKN